MHNHCTIGLSSRSLSFITIASWVVVLIITSSCNDGRTTASSTSKSDYTEDISWVDTSSVQKGAFNKELLNNGKLEAFKQTEIKFRISETILKIPVKNGQRVKQGHTLAILENFGQENAVEQAQRTLEKAEIDMQDAFISYGYSNKTRDSIPPNIVKVAQTKSGYLKAQSDLKKAKYDLSHTKVVAPFSGIIANLEAQQYNQSDLSKPFCLLIDDSKLEVGFSVLETEISQISIGQTVEILPFSSSKSYKGEVFEINPLVNKNGMVKVKALIRNKGRALLSGMNVKIRILRIVPDQLMIPKSAVVMRQGKSVVFTWENGQAVWKYVKIELENSTQYSVSDGLEEGDILITSGNLNLAHKSKVKVNQQNL